LRTPRSSGVFARRAPPRLSRRGGSDAEMRLARSGWARPHERLARSRQISPLRAHAGHSGDSAGADGGGSPDPPLPPSGAAQPDGDCSRSGLTSSGARARVPRGTLDGWMSPRETADDVRLAA
jgi:hypothetical protein